MNIPPYVDLEAIKRLKYRYCRCIDTANIDELRELFTEDASVRYVGGSYLWEAQGRDKILEGVAWSFHSRAVAFHHVNHPEIDAVSATEATGVWYLKDWFLDMKNMIITDGSSLYRDRYVKRDGQWLIAHASYERIFEIVTPFTEMPNLTAHWLGKHAQPQPG